MSIESLIEVTRQAARHSLADAAYYMTEVPQSEHAMLVLDFLIALDTNSKERSMEEEHAYRITLQEIKGAIHRRQVDGKWPT